MIGLNCPKFFTRLVDWFSTPTVTDELLWEGSVALTGQSCVSVNDGVSLFRPL